MNDDTRDRGVSFAGALLLLFIGLRLAGAIDWSWWWVLSPLWVAPAIWLLVAIIAWLVRNACRGVSEKRHLRRALRGLASEEE